jgi:hypothetical protein
MGSRISFFSFQILRGFKEEARKASSFKDIVRERAVSIYSYSCVYKSALTNTPIE